MCSLRLTEASAHLPILATLSLVKEPLAVAEEEVRWALERVWKIWGRWKGTCSVPASNGTPMPPVVQPVTHGSNPRPADKFVNFIYTRVGTLIVATIYLQLIQNRYMFRSFTALQFSHQYCVQPVASDVEVVGYLQQRLLC